MTQFVTVPQGRFEVAGAGDGVTLFAVLGSCISTCLYDPVARVGGMNHFLLVSSPNSNLAAASFGVNAMELLINAMMKAGADRRRLRARAFGGASMPGLRAGRAGAAPGVSAAGAGRAAGGAGQGTAMGLDAGSDTGGASIGERNITFCQAFLAAESIPLDQSDFGGNSARRVVFDPVTGLAQCRATRPITDVPAPVFPTTRAPAVATGELEMF